MLDAMYASLKDRGITATLLGGRVLVINSDHVSCLEKLGKDYPNFASCFINDPPYGTTSCSWDTVIPFQDFWDSLAPCVQPTGAKIVFGSQPFSSLLVVSNLKEFRYELIWDKNKCGSPGLAKYRPMKTHENMMVFSQSTHNYYPVMEKGEPYARKQIERSKINNHGYGLKSTSIENTGTRYPKSVRFVPRDFSAQQQIHPTQKPVNLLRWLILTYSLPGEIVLDSTAGSCSTGVAAIKEGRRCVLIEKDENYYNCSIERLKSALLNAPFDAGASR